MTLEQIKNEITASLKEVRENSRDFSGCESYGDLQSLFKKAIGRIALCESGEDIEAVGDLLMAIEELYNDCNSEFLNQPSDIELFSFNFELDENIDEQEDEEFSADEEENDEEDEEEDEDDQFDEDDYEEPQRKEKRTKAKKNADTDLTFSEKRAAFDQKHASNKLKIFNTMRLCIGVASLLSGIGIGLVDALWWPWEWYAWATVGLGLSYLILSAIYAIAIATKSKKAVRAMALTRLILAFVMIAVSIVLGLLLPYGLTVGGAFIATLPFTVFGFLTYFIYRIRLSFAAKASKKSKNK